MRKTVVNVNCVDSFGRGALTLAIDNENLEMVELLIIMGVETKDALLEAINQEFVEAVELLLEHEELIRKEGEAYVRVNEVSSRKNWFCVLNSHGRKLTSTRLRIRPKLRHLSLPLIGTITRLSSYCLTVAQLCRSHMTLNALAMTVSGRRTKIRFGTRCPVSVNTGLWRVHHSLHCQALIHYRQLFR